jgi:hypothetical protein
VLFDDGDRDEAVAAASIVAEHEADEEAAAAAAAAAEAEAEAAAAAAAAAAAEAAEAEAEKENGRGGGVLVTQLELLPLRKGGANKYSKGGSARASAWVVAPSVHVHGCAHGGGSGAGAGGGGGGGDSGSGGGGSGGGGSGARGRSFSRNSDRENCCFKPQRSRKAKKAMQSKECGYDFLEKVDDTDFITRAHMFQRDQEGKIERTRGEMAYDQKQDKLCCRNCGSLQSYDQVQKKLKRCPSPCKGEYLPKGATWETVGGRFIERMQRREAEKADRLEGLTEQLERRARQVGEEDARHMRSTTRRSLEWKLEDRERRAHSHR